MIYAGGESSRVYAGRWQVCVWFRQADGQAVWDETDVSDYDACLSLVRSFGDDGRWQGLYRVERAWIIPALPSLGRA